MIRLNRALFLQCLESVAPGLSSKELITQGTCFVFNHGNVITFNDEIACLRKSPIELTGAVKAKPLLELLSRLSDDELGIELADGKLNIKGKQKKAGVLMESDVLLPVDSIESSDTCQWVELPSDFSQAVTLVAACAGRDQSEFVLTCVNVTPTHLEATDRYQFTRYPMNLDLDSPLLVRAESIRKMVNLGMTHMGVTPAWLHFKSASGLVFSLRRYTDDYPDLDGLIGETQKQRIAFPGGLSEIVKRVEVFTADNSSTNHVVVSFRDNQVILEGTGAYGFYKEMKQVVYQGDPVRFNIAPELLLELAAKSNEFWIENGKLCVDTGVFRYMTSTKSESPESQEV